MIDTTANSRFSVRDPCQRRHRADDVKQRLGEQFEFSAPGHGHPKGNADQNAHPVAAQGDL